jgi:predicted hydrocarbon binding protein
VIGKDRNGRTVLVPDSFFEALGVRLLKYFGPNAAESLLYEIGRDAGKTYARRMRQALGDRLGTQDGMQLLLERFAGYGWARLRFRTLDVPSKFAFVEWRDGIGVPKGGSPVPVCHLGRGLLSGAAEVVFDAPCDAIEVKCQAMGADACEIVVGMPERMASIAESAEDNRWESDRIGAR